MGKDEGSSGGQKVYSPDLQLFSLEGKSGVFGTIASFIVGPIRLLSRVAHNVMILPANLLASYAEGLFFCGLVLGVLGVVDYLVYDKWPLIVSQVPVLMLARHFKQRAKRAVVISQTKHEVEIDNEQVSTLCNTIYDELDQIVGKEGE